MPPPAHAAARRVGARPAGCAPPRPPKLALRARGGPKFQRLRAKALELRLGSAPRQGGVRSDFRTAHGSEAPCASRSMLGNAGLVLFFFDQHPAERKLAPDTIS